MRVRGALWALFIFLFVESCLCCSSYSVNARGDAVFLRTGASLECAKERVGEVDSGRWGAEEVATIALGLDQVQTNQLSARADAV